jgi:hypothetical protein
MADRVLHWFIGGHVGPGDGQGSTFELDDDYTPLRIALASETPVRTANLEVDIDYTFEGVTSSIFTTPLPGIQKDSSVGERDYFVEPRLLKRGGLVKFNVDTMGGDGGRNLNVHLELERV